MPLTAEQVEVRKTGIGASEIGAILGVDPYKSAIDLYLEKVGKTEPQASTRFTAWGNRLEEVIAQAYIEEEAPGAILAECSTLRHREHAWMLATPDRLIIPAATEFATPAVASPSDGGFETDRLPAGSRGLECKNRNIWSARDWGESHTDEVPEVVAAQCHWGMAVTGLDRWDVAMLLGGNELRVYQLVRNDKLIDALIEIGQDFWSNHVVPGIMPKIDGSKAALDYLARTFRLHSDAFINATPAMDLVARELFSVKADIKEMEQQESLLKAQLMEFIGNAAGCLGTDWRISWKRTKDSLKTDWEAVAKEVGSLHADELTAALVRFTTPQSGYRRFLPTAPKEK